MIILYLTGYRETAELSEKLDTRVVHKVEHDRTFKKHHDHPHHHTKKGAEEMEDGHQSQTIRALSGVRIPHMFLINQGMAVEDREDEYDANDGDSDDFLNLRL